MRKREREREEREREREREDTDRQTERCRERQRERRQTDRQTERCRKRETERERERGGEREREKRERGVVRAAHTLHSAAHLSGFVCVVGETRGEGQTEESPSSPAMFTSYRHAQWPRAAFTTDALRVRCVSDDVTLRSRCTHHALRLQSVRVLVRLSPRRMRLRHAHVGPDWIHHARKISIAGVCLVNAGSGMVLRLTSTDPEG